MRKLYSRRSYKKKTIYYNFNKHKHFSKIIFIILCIIGVTIINSIISGRNMCLKKADALSNANIIRAGFVHEIDQGAETEVANILSNILIQQLGKPYVYGNAGPDSFDCSGLIKYVYSKVDINLPRVVADQSKFGEPIKKEDLKFGDIIFFSADGYKLTHVGIFVGNGYFVHAPKSGDVVKISTISSGYYAKTYMLSIRVLS